MCEPNEAESQDNLHRYREALRKLREALMAGLKQEGRKAINMNKITEILQKSDESPAQFYERLCEAFCL
jgi:glycine cleavage system protein P-like pyridoxal-binding family